jgi:hypothetical protein
LVYLLLYSFMENTTRISDLPVDGGTRQSTTAYASNIPPTTISVSKAKTNKMDGEMPTNYAPINSHPNPYGVSAQNPIMDIPSQTQFENNGQMPQVNNGQMPQVNNGQMPPENIQMIQATELESLQNLQHQRLPSRNIPQDTVQYSNDDQVQPNYIPKHNVERDYVKDQYDMTEQNLKEYEQKKLQLSYWDRVFTDFQTPIFIAVLFFFFQLPIINTIIFKRFSFLSLYNADGNFNMIGLIFKSTLFGSLYYMVSKFTTFISEL